MSVNSTVLLQMVYQYRNYKASKQPRTFKFTKNNLMRVHRETDDEVSRRHSILSDRTREIAEKVVKQKLVDRLAGTIDKKVWVDPGMKRIAVPIQNSTGSSGFGILPTGSRVKIPNGKKIRAFTYWEKVNDIDLSCFGVSEDGDFEEFSWRYMWHKQSDAVIFSGDETSGYNGGSEYFDINVEAFKREYPNSRYVIFCDNVFSMKDFSQCYATGGFMVRDEDDSGEIFEPKTVQTSFRVTADTTYCYLFAIDLKKMEMIWLNIAREDRYAIAGESEMEFLLDYFKLTEAFNVYKLFKTAAKTIVERPEEADVVVTAKEYLARNGQEVIHPYDTEKIMAAMR